MTLAQDLIATRRLLVERGRVVDMARDARGRVCLGEAMTEAVGADEDRSEEMYRVLIAHMNPYEVKLLDAKTYVGSHHRGIISLFNDLHVDDQDVFDVIDKALADLGAI